jgi:hypothetical protein
MFRHIAILGEQALSQLGSTLSSLYWRVIIIQTILSHDFFLCLDIAQKRFVCRKNVRHFVSRLEGDSFKGRIHPNVS